MSSTTGSAAAPGPGLDAVAAQTRELAARAGRDAAVSREMIARERAELTARVKELRAGEAATAARVEAMRKKFEAQAEREKGLREELAGQAAEIKGISGVVRGHAKEADALLRSGPLLRLYPDAERLLAPLLDDARFPGLDAIRGLARLFLDMAVVTGDVRRSHESFLGPEGREVQGDVVRLGGLSALYRDASGEVGFLRVGASGALSAVPATSWSEKSSVRDFLDGVSAHVPVDVSGGAALRALMRHKGWLEWLESGGVLVWPILFVGVLALILGLERVVTLSRVRSNSDRVFADLLRRAQGGDWKRCRDWCLDQTRFAACRVLGGALANAGQPREVVDRALEEGLLREGARLERFLPTLSVLAAIAPLLGLLGTVTGMIETFQVITLYGTGDPRMMSGGISEALITTQLGLAVAIPIMALHHLLDRRVERILTDMEEKSTALTVALFRREPGGPAEPAGPQEREVRHAA
ncbi:MAG: MotA/TolQ/ExbB proton channel family protein [Desulfovibrionaceae bacterium]|nr:MotA/TolQ/ExbB proton channel family protein [Desulfovibrionaceae bacterium]